MITIVIFSVIYKRFLFSDNSYKQSFLFSFSVQLSLENHTTRSISENIRFLILFQSFFGTFFFSFFMGIIIYKLINSSKKLLFFENKIVFYPVEGSFRARVMNISKVNLVNVKVNFYMRIWNKNKKKFTTFDINLKRQIIPVMETKIPWFIVSNPNSSYENLSSIQSDKDRKINFHPAYTQFPKKAKRNETWIYTLLSGYIPNINVCFSELKKFKIDDFICGEFIKVNKIPGQYNYSNLSKTKPIKSSYCINCDYRNCCCISNKTKKSIVKKNNKIFYYL